jgi:hypothetical protein
MNFSYIWSALQCVLLCFILNKSEFKILLGANKFNSNFGRHGFFLIGGENYENLLGSKHADIF